jgi:hypothetical protein
MDTEQKAEDQLALTARGNADKRLDAALGALRRAAAAIGKEYNIPEDVQGNSVEELLGRIAYVPSLSRELRKHAGLAMAKQELAKVIDLVAATLRPPEPVRPAAAASTGGQPVIPAGLDVADLKGITVTMGKQLKAAGFNQVGDLVNVPDEHLAKLTNWDVKACGKLRAAIAKASAPA